MNLAETQQNLVRGMVVLAILIFTFYTGRFLIVQSIKIYTAINPPDLPIPASSFGQLPQIKMTRVQTTGTPQYVLDTQTGNLPSFPDRLKVYPLVEPTPTLLSEQKIRQLATDLQFTGTPSKLTNSVFRWVDGANTRTFQADAVTENFKLDTPPFRLSTILAATPSIAEEDAISNVQGFIKSKSLLSPTDFENLAYNVIPTQVSLGQIREAKSLTTNAKLLKVDVFVEIPGTKKSSRSPDVKYRILGPNPKDSLINFSTTNSSTPVTQYPIINFTYFEPDYANGSEYYLSPIQDVWTAIQKGSGIVSYIRTQSGDYYVPIEGLNLTRIEIRDVYIAYFMEPEYAPYLQPIYVFQGQATTNAVGSGNTGEIFIYFPAVRGDYIKAN